MSRQNERARQIGNRIRLRRQDLGMTQEQLAAAAAAVWPEGDTPPTRENIYAMERGHVQAHRHPGRLAALAKVLGCHPSDLLEGRPAEELQARSMRRIPVLGDLAAGAPAAQHGMAVDTIEVEDWGSQLARWGRRIAGISMEPKLHSGDLCIFEERQAELGDIVHAVSEGVDTIKVYRKEDGMPVLLPINPESTPIDARNWRIKGVLVEVRRDLGQGIEFTMRNRYGGPLRPERIP